MTIQAQSFFNRMLLRYPKIDTPEIISAGWTFDQTLTRKSTTVSYTTPPEDTSEDMLVYRDKDNNIIGSISFTQYADGNVGVNFKLGEHTYTIRISDEGHIGLRSSYPLCGFISGTDEVATAEYVIDCSKANDEILENSLKEYTQRAINDTETELKQYSDDKDNALKVELKDYTDNKISTLRSELTAWKNGIIATIHDALSGISDPTVAIEFGTLRALFQSSRSEYVYTPSTNGILILGWDRDGKSLYWWVNDVQQTGANPYIGEWVNKGTGEIPCTFALKAGVKYKWQSADNPNSGLSNNLKYAFWTSVSARLIR